MIKDEEEELRAHRRFLAEMEREIQAANQQIIHAAIPSLNRKCLIDLGLAVARQRAAYLRKAIEFSQMPPEASQQSIVTEELGALRRTFEEARDAFAALERAIDRGYIDIDAG